MYIASTTIYLHFFFLKLIIMINSELIINVKLKLALIIVSLSLISFKYL